MSMANIAKSFENFGTALNSATHSAINNTLDLKMQDIKIRNNHFAMAENAMRKRASQFWNEQIKNPNTDEYKKNWENELNGMFENDNLKKIGLSEKEAEEFQSMCRSKWETSGQYLCDTYIDISQKNSILQTHDAQIKMIANSDGEFLAKFDDAKRLYDGSDGVVRKADLSGAYDPENPEFLSNFAYEYLTYKEKAIMESVIAGDMTYGDGLKAIEEEWTKTENFCKKTLKDNKQVESFFATNKDSGMLYSKKYYAEQNTIDYTDRQARASDAYAYVSESIATNSLVELNELNRLLENAGIKKKSTNANREEIGNRLLENAGITKKSTNANSEKIRNTLYASAIQHNQSIRGDTTQRISLLTENDSIAIKTKIATFDVSKATYTKYSLKESGTTVAEGEYADISNTIDDSLYKIYGDEEGMDFSVKTKYGPIVDEFCEKYGISTSEGKMFVASKVNEMANEMSMASSSSSSSSSSGKSSFSIYSANSEEAMIYEMLHDPQKYSTKQVKDTFNQSYVKGKLSPKFVEYYTENFGVNGEKRKEDLYYTTSKSIEDDFMMALGPMLTDEEKRAIIWELGKNGIDLREMIDEKLRSNKDLLLNETGQREFATELANFVLNSKCATELSDMIDSFIGMASGTSDTYAGFEDATASQIYDAVADGSADAYIDLEAYKLIKLDLYGENSKDFNKDTLLNITIDSITGHKYKTLKEMKDDKGLSDGMKGLYESKAYVTVSKATKEVAQFKQSEKIAKCTAGDTAVKKGAGEGLREIRLDDGNIGCVDNAGYVYVSESDSKIDVYYMAPFSAVYERSKEDNNAIVYKNEMEALGTYVYDPYKELQLDPDTIKNLEYYGYHNSHFETEPVKVRVYGKDYEPEIAEKLIKDLNSYKGIEGGTFPSVYRQKKTDEDFRNDPELRSIQKRSLDTTYKPGDADAE